MNSDSAAKHPVCVYLGDALAAYGFGNDHPFGPQRHSVFSEAFYRQLLHHAVDVLQPAACDRATLELFHTHGYIERVMALSRTGIGFLDHGDTPAFAGMFEAVCHVAGSVCDAIDRLLQSEYRRAFVPIAGLHHARRDQAAGFCVVNDCGVAIEYLKKRHGIHSIAYVDIDAHHGDGVFYSFADDPDLVFADTHEDGTYLYPGTGDVSETGIGEGAGHKLNVPMPPGSDDNAFMRAWPSIENFIRRHDPEFILLQCGADSIRGDPITHMALSEASHAHAARQLCKLADEVCEGRLVAMGGGGYNHDNIARAWTSVVRTMIESSKMN